MAEATRMEGWRPARIAAVAAGSFLLWRGLFGRRGRRLGPFLAGAFILGRALEMGTAPRSRAAKPGSRSREVDVVEVKSPAELEPGVASASPRPTFPNRVDRGRES